jgi:hypothetical protein
MRLIPLVYTLHLCFLSLSFSFSLVHKHFTMRISMCLYLVVKLAEIMFFYFYALYLQANECLYMSSAVHIVFDLTVYHMLLDFLALMGFNQDDFKFDISKVGNKDKLRWKIIFNCTLIAISYISQVQFVTVFSGFFMYFHGFFLIIRCLQCCKTDKIKKTTSPTTK